MISLISRAKRIFAFFADRTGTTAVEYAMMVMLVFLAALTAVTYFGQTTAQNLEDSRTSLQGALDSRP
jgi:Flp pilus assembly pilin Flp